jgi:MraZ protein
MLTGVVVCLVCVVVTLKLIQGGAFSRPADNGSDPAEPLPELSDPVPLTPPPVPDLPPNGDQQTPPAPVGRVDMTPLPSHPVSRRKPEAEEDDRPLRMPYALEDYEEVPPPAEELPPPHEEGATPLPVLETPPPEPMQAMPAVRIVPAPERGPLVNLALQPTLTIRFAAAEKGSGTATANVLIGAHPCVLEEGRVKLPASVREQLGDVAALVVLPGQGDCLLLCPPAGLAAIRERLAAAGPEQRRLVFGRAVRCPVDPDGSLALPKELAERADLRRELVLVGAGEYFELWESATWREKGQ